ncbi:hypothetical protein BT96DRAFT_977836 [Gymnopus androsaceus JB14]|uniref:Uncharacterized protein n=1 Tax=Gymnopus androsaceus JB14 TaxID=1447944 RepID=A0A6A4HF77_9AGAR|nr:hypothetical protein BT96DRAFT_977836 [Gymnopus androsaceus JB14]
MTLDESQEIVFAGAIFFENISEMIFLCALNGVYTLAFAISIYILLQRKSKSLPHKALTVLILAGFAMSIIYSWSTIAYNLLLAKFGLVVSLPGGILVQDNAGNLKSLTAVILEDWAGILIFLIADTVILWRAWAVWPDSGLIKWTLLFILLLDIGVNIADITVNTRANLVGTLFIAYRAWKHHRSVKGISKKRTHAESILLLIIESGAIYGLVQCSDKDFYFNFQLMNPVALVLLIQTGKTYEHSVHLEDMPSIPETQETVSSKVI